MTYCSTRAVEYKNEVLRMKNDVMWRESFMIDEIRSTLEDVLTDAW